MNLITISRMIFTNTFILVLLISCSPSDLSQTPEERTQYGLDSVSGDVLSNEQLRDSFNLAFGGDANAQNAISNHISAMNGRENSSSLGWRIAAAENGNLEAMQSLSVYFLSLKNKRGCELATFWADEALRKITSETALDEIFDGDKLEQNQYINTLESIKLQCE